MFRKIRSNRDPRDTVLTGLKREFSSHFNKARTGLKATANNHSKFIFWMMVINIVLSAALSFAVFRHREPPPKKAIKITTPFSDGFSQVIQASEAIKEMIILRKQIDSLSAKKQLAPADSAFLDSALTRFNQLNHQFNPRK